MSDENKEYDGIRYRAEKKSPLVFRILFSVLIVWGVSFMGYYLFSGWSSQTEYAGLKKAKELRLATQKVSGEAEAVNIVKEKKPGALLVQGKKDFAERCASCHGADARGGLGIGPDLTRKKFKYGKNAQEVTRSILEGRPGGMPAFKNDLQKDKVEGLVEYVLSL
jgi:cytochrome c oxidase cbb3-type subunit III